MIGLYRRARRCLGHWARVYKTLNDAHLVFDSRERPVEANPSLLLSPVAKTEYSVCGVQRSDGEKIGINDQTNVTTKPRWQRRNLARGFDLSIGIFHRIFHRISHRSFHPSRISRRSLRRTRSRPIEAQGEGRIQNRIAETL